MGLSQHASASAQKAQQKLRSFEDLSVEERAELIPKQIFDYKKSEPAFIFSKENLIVIRRYASVVRNLPPDLAALRESADFETFGLRVEDLFVFHQNLRTHVASWDAIQDACKKIGNQLQLFAEDFQADGAKFIASAKENVANAPAQSHDGALLPASLTNALKESAEIYLGHILEETKRKRNNIQHVKKLIDIFGNAITGNLQPMGAGLAKTLTKRNPNGEIAELGEALDKLDQRIEEAARRYFQFVGSAFYGLVFGPIGLAITGGIYGAKAEQVRSEKNGLIKKRKELAERRAALLQGLDAFELLQTSIADIGFRLVEVMTAVEHLEDVWGLLEVYAQTSIDKVSEVSTLGTLKKFIAQLDRVMRPWDSIAMISKEISLLFNEPSNVEREG